jgi:regulator of nonsense transcripts 2
MDAETQAQAKQQLDVLSQEKLERSALRQSNSATGVLVFRKEHEANKKQLKSDLKKASTFVNKLRTATNTESIQQCIRDVDALNLTLYVSEIVGAITEFSFKPNDTPTIVKLCIALHRRYEEFAPSLVGKVQQSLLSPPSTDKDDVDKDAGKKKRMQIRLILELLDAGLCVDTGYFLQLLRVIAGRNKM